MERELEEKDINFIGSAIENCGNSCFMNSVNQMLFHIPELREFMIENRNIFEVAIKKEQSDNIILNLIGLFMAIKERNKSEVILEDTPIYPSSTLNNLYVNVHKKYFDSDDEKKDNLEVFDREFTEKKEELERLKNYINSKTLSEESKKDKKEVLIKFLKDNMLEHLRDLTNKRILEKELSVLKEDPNKDSEELKSKIKWKESQIELEDKNIDNIDYSTIFERINDQFKDRRKSQYATQEAASELLRAYLASSNESIENYLIIKNYDKITIYNKNPTAMLALNNEFFINKINLPFFDIFLKRIEFKNCISNGFIFENKIIYESNISFKEKFKITLDDIEEPIYYEDCGKGLNTLQRTKFIPNKYIIINVGREYTQVYKKVYKVIKKETKTTTEEELKTTLIFNDKTKTFKIKFKDQENVEDWSDQDGYKIRVDEKKCEMFRDEEGNNKFRDDELGVVDLITNIDNYNGLYIKKQEINETPIENYDTVKNEMTINYNNGHETIEYELVGTICKWGEVEGGHYWYHHKIKNIWYEFNDDTLGERSPKRKYMLILLFRKKGAEYRIPIYKSVEDMKLHILQQINKNIMTYDNELSDDLSKIAKLKEDIERLSYYSSSIGKNKTSHPTSQQVIVELQQIREKLKQKISSNPILKP